MEPVSCERVWVEVKCTELCVVRVSTRVKMSVGSAVLEQPLDSGLEA